MVNISKKEETKSLYKYIEYSPEIKSSLVLQMIGVQLVRRSMNLNSVSSSIASAWVWKLKSDFPISNQMISCQLTIYMMYPVASIGSSFSGENVNNIQSSNRFYKEKIMFRSSFLEFLQYWCYPKSKIMKANKPQHCCCKVREGNYSVIELVRPFGKWERVLLIVIQMLRHPCLTGNAQLRKTSQVWV